MLFQLWAEYHPSKVVIICRSWYNESHVVAIYSIEQWAKARVVYGL
jgi:hypothetical protein